MSYEVRLRRAVQKELDSLSGRDFEEIAVAISALEQNPRPAKVKKLADSGLWRIRIGRYRVVYTLDDMFQVITIVRSKDS